MPTGNHIKRLLFHILPPLFFLLNPSLAPAQEIPPQDVVFLIDASESDSSRLPAITGIVRRFVAGANIGDSFSCYQFSNKPVLIAQRKVRRQSDIQLLQDQLLQLHEAESSTNYSPAVEKGLNEIQQLYRQNPVHDRLLVLITDGRSSGDIQSEKSNFNLLLNSFADIQAGSEYYFTCFYIGTSAEKDLRDFLFSTGARLIYWPADRKWLEQLTLADVRIVETERDMGIIPRAPSVNTFTLSFSPRRAPERFTMIEMNLEEHLNETLDNLFDIRPRRIACQKKFWIETFTFEMRGFKKGDYTNRLLLFPSEPERLLLYPYAVPFTFSISERLEVIVPETLIFGPTGLKGRYNETKKVFLQPSRQYSPELFESIDVDADISLPEGLNLSVSPVLQEKSLAIVLTVSREQQAVPQSAGEYAGILKVWSSADMNVDRHEIPILVRVDRKPFNYSRLILAAGIAGGAVASLAALLLLFGGIRKGVFDYFSNISRPAGKLIPLRDPTRGLAKRLDLYPIAEKHAKNGW